MESHMPSVVAWRSQIYSRPLTRILGYSRAELDQKRLLSCLYHRLDPIAGCGSGSLINSFIAIDLWAWYRKIFVQPRDERSGFGDYVIRTRVFGIYVGESVAIQRYSISEGCLVR